MGITFVVVMLIGLGLLGMRLRKFDWGLFAVTLIGIVMLAVAAPLLQRTWLAAHPGVEVVLILAAILAFVVAVSVWGLKRKRARGL